MTKEEIEAEARLYALEVLVCQIGATVLLQSGDPLNDLSAQMAQQKAGARQKTFPELGGAALSDSMAAELEAAIGRLGEMQKALVEVVLRRGGSQ
jgi:hypothetical protein